MTRVHDSLRTSVTRALDGIRTNATRALDGIRTNATRALDGIRTNAKNVNCVFFLLVQEISITNKLITFVKSRK